MTREEMLTELAAHYVHMAEAELSERERERQAMAITLAATLGSERRATESHASAIQQSVDAVADIAMDTLAAVRRMEERSRPRPSRAPHLDGE